jgi:hypothetical protein
MIRNIEVDVLQRWQPIDMIRYLLRDRVNTKLLNLHFERSLKSINT